MRKSPYVSIIFDTTQDLTKIDQLSTVFHYVQIKKDEEDRPIKLVVKVTFGGFKEQDSP